MGLDGVEMVIRTEEAFEVAIEDAEAEKITTPGELIDLVMGKVGRTHHDGCLTQRAFRRLRAAMMRRLGVERHHVRADLVLADLFPKPNRKERVREVLSDIGMDKEIGYVRPVWLKNLIVAGTIAGAAGLALSLSLRSVVSRNPWLNFILGSPVLAGVLFAVIAGLLASVATRGMRVEFPPSLSTVRHFSWWIVAHGPGVVQAPPGPWSRERVSTVVREIVVDSLGCEKEYREDAKFIRDLGLN